MVEAIRRAHLGTKHSEESQRKISEAHKRQGTKPSGQRLQPRAERIESKRCRMEPANHAVRAVTICPAFALTFGVHGPVPQAVEQHLLGSRVR